MKPLRLFIGFDKRQPIAYTVAAHSALLKCSVPLSITALNLPTLPAQRRGLTEFTFSRYLVPWLCDYEGYALFIDSDMLVLGDLAELPWDHGAPVAWVPHSFSELRPQQKLKFERPSVMLFNNERCKVLTPEFIQNGDPESQAWASSWVSLDPAWNHLVGYDKPRPDAKIVHFTQGIPCFEETCDDEYANEWRMFAQDSQSTVPWGEISGKSVHAQHKRTGSAIQDMLSAQLGGGNGLAKR